MLYNIKDINGEFEKVISALIVWGKKEKKRSQILKEASNYRCRICYLMPNRVETSAIFICVTFVFVSGGSKLSDRQNISFWCGDGDGDV